MCSQEEACTHTHTHTHTPTYKNLLFAELSLHSSPLWPFPMSGFLFYAVGPNPNLPRVQPGCQVEGSVYKINRDITTKICQTGQTCIIRWEIMSTCFIDKLHNMITTDCFISFWFSKIAATFSSQCSPSTTWGLRIKRRLPGIKPLPAEPPC